MSSRHLLLFAKTFFAVRQKVSKNGFTCKSAPELWSAAEADQGRCRTPRTPSPPWSSWLRFGSNLFQSKCRFTKSTMFHWQLKKTHSLTGKFFCGSVLLSCRVRTGANARSSEGLLDSKLLNQRFSLFLLLLLRFRPFPFKILFLWHQTFRSCFDVHGFHFFSFSPGPFWIDSAARASKT